jgi:hypothetical protein
MQQVANLMAEVIRLTSEVGELKQQVIALTKVRHLRPPDYLTEESTNDEHTSTKK